MKKRTLMTIAAVLAVIGLLAGCDTGNNGDTDIGGTGKPDNSDNSNTGGFTLSFNANGGTGSPPSPRENVQGGVVFNLPGNTYGMTNGDAVFGGWNTNTAGTGTTYNIGADFTMPNDNTTLYAKWNESDEGTNGPKPPIPPINKYEAIPYTGGNIPARAAALTDSIKYSYSYENYDIYYIYLGELKNIPLFHRDARMFTGTDWTYTFTTTDITEIMIRDTVSTSSQEAISVIKEHTDSTTFGIKASQEIATKTSAKTGGLTAFLFGNASIDVTTKIGFEESFSTTITDKKTNIFQQTTSLTNTVDHATTKTKSTMESDSWNLSRAKGDEVGYYRYTYFAASDVYLYAIRDSATKEVLYYEFREYVIPDAYFWSLDFSETGSFRKSDTTSFEFDVSQLNNLPKPANDLTPAVSFNLNGGSGSIPASIKGLSIDLPNGDGFSKTGQEFIGWNTRADGEGTAYASGSSFDVPEPYIDVVLYAEWKRQQRTERKVFTTAGIHSYSFNESFPATVEVYVLGAGGGGQGGHHDDNPSWYAGTGAAGGGGAAAYMKFSVAGPGVVAFNDITVGQGGRGAGGFKTLWLWTWRAGTAGGHGGDTSVTVTNGSTSTTLTAQGGRGGGSSNRDKLPGGAGGVVGSMPTGHVLLDWDTQPGNVGSNGERKKDLRSTNRGGAAAIIEKGSEDSFGGGSGAISGTAAQPGGGGNGGFDDTRMGVVGGNGLVVIVVTY